MAKKHQQPRHLLLPILLACGFLLQAAASRSGKTEQPDHVQAITLLSRKIDSLDLLKQDLKRNGQTISEIEQQQDSLRDSVRQLQKNIQTVATTLPSMPVEKNPFFFLRKPASFFDWIIIITGGIASFSGLMLIFGITRMLAIKRKVEPRKPAGPQKTAPATQVNTAPPSTRTACPDNPGSRRSSAPDAVLPEQPGKLIDRQQNTHPSAANATAEIPSPSPLPEAGGDSSNETLEKRVLAESRRGQDVSAISRKFHLSADHVALILKMAEKRTGSR